MPSSPAQRREMIHVATSVAGSRPLAGRTYSLQRRRAYFALRTCKRVLALGADQSERVLHSRVATIGEHAFSVLLLIGLASRLSALGLFGMTMVIQLFVFPDGWPEHILWISLQLLIISRGPGTISLDHLIWTRAPRMLVAIR